MGKGQRVQNLISGQCGTLVKGNCQDPPPSRNCVAVFSVKLANGQYRYWNYANVSLPL